MKVGEGWLGEPPWEGRELISDSKWPPGYQVSGEERGIMASIINEGRRGRTRKRKILLPHTPGSLVQGQSRGRGCIMGVVGGHNRERVGYGLHDT